MAIAFRLVPIEQTNRRTGIQLIERITRRLLLITRVPFYSMQTFIFRSRLFFLPRARAHTLPLQFSFYRFFYSHNLSSWQTCSISVYSSASDICVLSANARRCTWAVEWRGIADNVAIERATREKKCPRRNVRRETRNRGIRRK